MMHTQILVRRWGPEQGFQRCFADRFNQKLRFVCDTGQLGTRLGKMGLFKKFNKGSPCG